MALVKILVEFFIKYLISCTLDNFSVLLASVGLKQADPTVLALLSSQLKYEGRDSTSLKGSSSLTALTTGYSMDFSARESLMENNILLQR